MAIPVPATKSSTPVYDAFLSYGRSDREVVADLARRLESDGLKVFAELRPSEAETWGEPLFEALRGSAVVLEVIGEGGLDPLGRISLPGLLDRAGRADMPAIPLLLPDAPRGLGLPDWLSRHQWIDLRGRDLWGPDAQALIRDAIRAAASQDGAPVASAPPDLAARFPGRHAAADLVAGLLRMLEVTPPAALGDVRRGTERDAGEWLGAAAALWRKSAEVDVVRSVVGVALLEPALWTLLADEGILGPLVARLEGPLDQQLTSRGLFLLAEADTPLAAGFRPDSLDGEDALGVRADAAALADVMMTQENTPPLSIGLFGDWGAGKSFFMAELQRQVDGLAQRGRARAEQGLDPHWCTDVRQITFNAWHYLDANLWASLAARVLEEIDGGESAKRRALMRELSSLQAAREKLEATRADAERAKAERSAELARLEQEKERKATVLDSVRAAVVSDETGSDLLALAQALGLPSGALSEDDLEQMRDSAGTFGRRARETWRLLGRSPHAWRRRLLLAATVVAVAGIAFLATRPGALGALLTGGSIATALAAAGRIASAVLPPASAALARASKALETVEQREEARQAEIAALQAQVETLEQQIADRQAEEEQVDARIDAQRAGLDGAEHFYDRVLGGFASDEYRAKLGVVSAIRRDFEQLATQLPTGEFPGLEKVDRIVLYIDDLDRCDARQVVAVLQAVHLLLAFRLFVVVVGVDPRWLLRSLRLHHAALAQADAPVTDAPAAELAHLAATPQAYLEKIFQIPLRLRPMGPEGYKRVMSNMLTVRQVVAAAPDAPADGNGAEPLPAGEPRASAEPVASVEQGAALPLDLEDHAPRPLVIEERELTFIAKLAPLLPTPRAAKRLANLYRFVRAQVPPSRAAAFVGTGDGDAEYPAVLVLLALLSAMPEEAERLVESLRRRPKGELEQATDAEGLFLACLDDDERTGQPGDRMKLAAALLPPGYPLARLGRWAGEVGRFSFQPAAR